MDDTIENNILEFPVTFRTLRVGETWTEWDVQNTADGLKRIPKAKIGTPIKYIRPRDIFLRPLSMLPGMTFKEWQRWNRRDNSLYD